MFVIMQPANLIESIHSDADPATRDEIRAGKVRKPLRQADKLKAERT